MSEEGSVGEATVQQTESQTPTRRRGQPAVSWVTQTRAFAVRNLRTLFRTKATIIWGFGFPAFWYFLTSIMFLPDASEVGGPAVLADVKGATAVALALFGVLTVTLVTFASGLSNDLTRKRYRKLRSLPVAPSADFAGRYFAGVAVAGVSYVIVILAGLVDGADFALRSPASVAIVILSFLLFSLVGVSVAVVVTWFVEDAELVVGVTNAVLLVGFFLTGYNGLTPNFLPEASRWVVNLAPNSLAARLQIWHLTDTPAAANLAARSTDSVSQAALQGSNVVTQAADTGITPPELPIGPEYVALLAAWAIGLGIVAAVLMDRSVYRGEGGE